MEERFLLMKGTFKSDGSGDEWVEGATYSLEEAKKEFDRIKKVILGIKRHRNGTIKTWIERQVWNKEYNYWGSPFEYKPDIIESYTIDVNLYGFARGSLGR